MLVVKNTSHVEDENDNIIVVNTLVVMLAGPGRNKNYYIKEIYESHVVDGNNTFSSQQYITYRRWT